MIVEDTGAYMLQPRFFGTGSELTIIRSSEIKNYQLDTQCTYKNIHLIYFKSREPMFYVTALYLWQIQHLCTRNSSICQIGNC